MYFRPGLVLSLALAVGHGGCQTFENFMVGLNYPNVTDICLAALNTTLTGCPGFLHSISTTNKRLNTEQLEALCTTDCSDGLQSARQAIASGCDAATDIVEFDGVVWPATYVIDIYAYTYDVACRTDATSGQYCDEIFYSWLNTSSSAFTSAQNCSDCMLGVIETQLNSPFGCKWFNPRNDSRNVHGSNASGNNDRPYHEEIAADFDNLTASCGATRYTYSSPTPYSITTVESSAETGVSCSDPYVVQSGDSCYSIAVAYGVSTHSIIKAGGLDPSCSNLYAGASICLPKSCSIYQVDYDDTCDSIVEAYGNFTAYQLLLWNPNIDALCRNIGSMLEFFLCVSAPGGSSTSASASAASTATTIVTTTTASATAASRPTNAADNSTTSCAEWYTVQSGDYCQAVSIRESISLKDFYFLNPSIDANCTNLLLDVAYCIEAVGSISTYAGYSTTTPLYTLTSSAYTTTTSTFSTTTASITPIVTLALADGTRSDCAGYVQYTEVTGYTDQTESNDVSVIPSNINSCEFAATAYEVTVEDFIAWNPSLALLDDCALQASYRYCALNVTSTTEDTHVDSRCLDVTDVYPGTISSCSCYTEIVGSDSGYYTCDAIITDFDMTTDDLTTWNTWIGSDCDTGLYNGLNETDTRAVCVGNNGTATTSPSSTTTTAASTTTSSVGPTQTGIVSGCTAYHTAVDGDGCWSIANDAGITLDQFYSWNPAVGDDCSNLWLGYSYCIAVASTTTASVVTSTITSATAASTTSSCTEYYTVVSGDSCYGIEQAYEITFETFYAWNPSIGSNCENLWIGSSYCVAADS